MANLQTAYRKRIDDAGGWLDRLRQAGGRERSESVQDRQAGGRERVASRSMAATDRASLARKMIGIFLAFSLAFTMMPLPQGSLAFADEGGEEGAHTQPEQPSEDGNALVAIDAGNPLNQLLSGASGMPLALSNLEYGSEGYWIEKNNGSITYTDLNSKTGKTLNTGVYYITGWHEVTNSAQGGHGLTINGAVTIRFVKNDSIGTTLTAKGANGSDLIAGGTGILVPFGSTLTIEGVGSIHAQGGSGSDPKGGESGKDGVIIDAKDDFYVGGAGGAGGDGSGAAGNAIGGQAGNGGKGGAGGETTGLVPAEMKDENLVSGDPGKEGEHGKDGGSMGTVVMKGSVALNAEQGASSEVKPRAGYGGVSRSDAGTGWEADYTAGGGAGGGAGTGGGNSTAIGSGASGGAGGGGGGGGAARWAWFTSYVDAAGSGGGGAAPLGAGGQGGQLLRDMKRAPSGENGGELLGGLGGKEHFYRCAAGGNGGSRGYSGFAGIVYSTTLESAAGTNSAFHAKSATRYQIYPMDECEIKLTGYVSLSEDGTPVYDYTGTQVKPAAEIIHVPTATKLTEGKHYTITYQANMAGMATATIKGTGLSTKEGTLADSTGTDAGTVQKQFLIGCDMESSSIMWEGYALANPFVYRYTGGPVGKAYLVSGSGSKIPASAYETAYENNVELGEETASVTFTIPASQAGNWFDPESTKTATFSIREAAIITTGQTAYYDALPGEPYSLKLNATGSAPLTWSKVTGTLPPGLELSADGLISGYPTKVGTYRAFIRVSNSISYDQKEFVWKTGRVTGFAWNDRNHNGKQDPGEDPLPGITVSAIDSATKIEVESTLTDENGYYILLTEDSAQAEKVDVKFTSPDASVYRVIGNATETDIVIGDFINYLDKGFDKSITMTLNSGDHGRFGNGSTKAVQLYPHDTYFVGTPSDMTVDLGWRLEGWYYDQGFTRKYDDIVPETDTQLYAKYDERTYEVEYITGEGVDPIAPYPVEFDDAGLLPAPAPTRPGYQLMGWVLSNDAGRWVAEGDTYSDLVGGNTSTIKVTLVAVWEYRSDLKVILDANGSTGAPATINGAPTEEHENLVFEAVLDYSPPIREGYSFTGWSTSKAYDPDTDPAPTMSLKVPPEVTTYYAVWEAKDIGIDFDANGGTFEDGEDGMRNGLPGETFDVPVDPTRKGYTFKGWFERPTDDELVFAPGTDQGNFPLVRTYYYAQWEPAQVTLVLEAEEGTPDSQTLTGAYETIVRYTLPARDGFNFMGWDVDGVPTVFMDFPAEDARYQAIWEAGASTIAYNPMGGAFAQGEDGIRRGGTGDGYAIPADPTRPGYVFDGWYTTPEYLTKAPDNGIIPPYSATYYARWQLADITVHLYADNVLHESPTGKFGSVIEYTAPVKPNAAFIGWKPAGVQDAEATMYPTYGVNDNERYDAVFEEGMVSVVYNAQGGTLAAGGDVRTGTAGDPYDIPGDPVKQGYIFNGWFDAPAGGNRVHTQGQATATFPSEVNTVYYAQYTALQVEVVLQAGADATPITQTIAGSFGERVDYQAPVRDGFTFMGWKLASAVDSSAVKNLAFPADDETYQAVWVEHSIIVTFEEMGGVTDTGDERRGIPNDTYELPKATYTGHAFLGWFDQAIGGNLVFAPGEVEGRFPSASVTYFAHWAPLAITATLDAGPGSDPEKQYPTGLYGEAIAYVLPSKPGNAFAGWKVEGSADSTAVMNPTFRETDGLTYVAVWAQGKSSISYDVQGGSFAGGDTGIRTGSVGDSYTAPADPSKQGFAFGGWFTLPDGQGSPYTATTFPADANTTVYAKWTPLQAETTLDLNYEGSVPLKAVGAVGSQIIYDMPTRTGYAFGGWATTPDDALADATYFPYFAGDTPTLYAQWAADAVTLRFHPIAGAFAGGEDGMRSGTAGGGYAIPANPVRPGYAFSGWFSDTQGGQQVVPNGVYPNAAATYYAQWEADSIRVFLDLNHTGAPAPTEVRGTFLDRIDYAYPGRTGYDFAGWAENPDALTGDLHPAFPQTSDSTLYATWVPRTVVVEYDPLGGVFAPDGKSTFTGNPGDAYAIPSATREGHAFNGWFTTPLGSNRAPDDALIPVEDAIYYAQWSKAAVTVTLKLAGGTVGGDADDLTLTGAYQDAVEYPEPTRESFAFVGWKAQGAADATATLFLSYPATDAVYEAVWVPESTATVTYNALGGHVDGQSMHSGDAGETFIAPGVKVRDGYAFGGWVAQAGSPVVDHNPGDTITFSARTMNTVYYALWVADSLTVTLDFNDEATVSRERTGTIGEMIDYASMLPVRAGFVFKGWGATPESSDYELFPRFTLENDGTTLYAQWDSAGLMVSFFEQEGSGADLVIEGKAGDAYAVPADPARAGFTFDGWYSLQNGAGDKLDKAAGEQVAFEEGMTNAWYAHWTQDQITVTLDADGGTIGGQGSIEATGYYGAPIPYEMPARDGYRFTGWSTGRGVTGSPTFPEATGDTYLASWKALNVRVIFDAMGGEYEGDEGGLRQGSVDDLLIPPQDPHRLGYTFGGWFLDTECTLPAESVGIYPTTSATYYAKWVPNTVTVQLSAPGSSIELQTYAGIYGGMVTYFTPAKPGHTFTGWKDRATGVTATHLEYPAADAVYDAQFIRGSIVVTFDANGGEYLGDETGLRAGETGSTAFVPEATAIARVGYAFEGWFTASSGGTRIGEADGSFTLPYAHQTYYAQWAPATVNMALDPQNGDGPLPVQGEHGTTVMYALPQKGSSTFVGWSNTPGNDFGDATMFPSFDIAKEGATLYGQWEDWSAMVAFNALEGAPNASFNVRLGESYTVPADPTHDGFTFLGWFDAPVGGQKQSLTAGQAVTVNTAGNYTYYAHYTEKTGISVTLEAGPEADHPTQNVTGRFGDAVTYTEPSRTGYVFKGWKLRTQPEQADGSALKDLTFPSDDATFDAVWQEGNITYTFDANKGVLAGDDTRIGVTDDAFALPDAPTRTGYAFLGWFTLPLGGSMRFAPDAANGVFGLTSATYYAHWAAIDSSIILSANGGVYNDQTEERTYSGFYDSVVDYEVPTKDGFAFLGWSTTSDNASDDRTVTVLIAEEGRTLYAVWTNHEATVIFNPQGGTFSDADEEGYREGAMGDPLGIVPALDPRSGYTFDGWYTEPFGQGVKLASDPRFENVGTDIYYAHWMPLSTQVSLDANGGAFPTGGATRKTLTGEPTDPIIYGEVPARAGYGFMGWSEDASDTAGTFFPVFGAYDATLYALWKPNAATLTFQPMGGVKASPSSDLIVTGDVGSDYVVPTVERKGYVFKRWWVDPADGTAGASTPGVPGQHAKMPSMDATYYAQWTAIDHALALDANEGSFADASTLKHVTGNQGGLVGALAGYLEPARSGYTFIGWSTTPDNGSDDATMLPRVDVDVATLYATWSVNTVTVTYNAAGGTGGGTVVQDAFSTYAAIPGGAPARVGYGFAGWFADPVDAGSAPHPMPSPAYTVPAEDTTWFAQWAPLTVTLTLDAQGGTFEGGDATKAYTGLYSAAVDYEMPLRPGYTFSGWDDGSQIGYSIAYPATDDVTYQAVWTPLATVGVTYLVEGGTVVNDGALSFTGLPHSTYAEAERATLERDGYTFTGWYSQPGGQGRAHPSAVGGQFAFPEHDTLWYASWAAVPIQVMLDPQGGSISGSTDPMAVTGTIGDRIAFPLPQRTGYSFIGWNTEDDATTGDMFPVYATALDTKTLYAIWEAGSTSATFFAGGGSFAAAENAHFTGKVGQTYTVPENPVRTGYTFEGWFEDADLQKEAGVSAGDAVAYSATEPNASYWAKWRHDEVEVTLRAQGGTIGGDAVKTETGYYGESVPYLLPERAGYTFLGWNAEANQTTGTIALTFPEQDGEYFAIWQAKAITVTFEGMKGDVIGEAVHVGAPGSPYNVPGAERDGYAFIGWATKPDRLAPDGPEKGTTESMPTASVAYYAQWEQDITTVTLNLNGGTVNGSADDIEASGYVEERILYTVPRLNNHIFMGWKTSSESDADAKMYIVFPALDDTFSAVWKRADLQSAVYHSLGGMLVGSGTYDDSKSDRYNAPLAEPQAGYRFAGWTTDPDSGVIDHRGGDSRAFGPDPVRHYYALYIPAQDIQVTLDPNGGLLDGTTGAKTYGNLTYGDRLAFNIPVREGYAFVGWTHAPDADASFMEVVVPASSATYYARWVEGDIGRLSYAHYLGNGGTIAGENLFSGYAGETYTAPGVEPREGYVFTGWMTEAAGGPEAVEHQAGDLRTFTAVAQTDYYARFEVVTDITLRFNVNGGTWDGMVDDDRILINQTYGVPLSLAMPTRAGHLFLGWSFDPQARVGNATVTVPAHDATYYAVWMDATSPSQDCLAIYDGAGGRIIGKSLFEGVGGSDYLAPSAERDGYVFRGWAEASNGAVSHQAGAAMTLPDAGWQRYHAIWVERTDITITLDLAGGSLIGPTVLTGQVYGSTIMPETPTRTGHVFMGWVDDLGLAPTSSMIVVGNGDASYTASWAPMPADPGETYVIYDGAAGSVVGERYLIGMPGNPYTAPSATRPGYAFKGWAKTPTGNVDHAADAACIFPDAAGTTYYALWSRDADITISADPDNGGPVALYEHQSPGDILYPNEPVNAGHIFLGWVKDGTDDQPSTAIAVPWQDASYTARWYQSFEPAELRIVLFDTQGGTLAGGASSVIAGGEGVGYALPDVEPRGGYEFNGWEQGGSLFDPGTTLTFDSSVQKVFTAQWSQAPVEVTLLAPGSDRETQVIQGMRGDAVGADPGYADPYLPGFLFMGWKLPAASDASAMRDLHFPEASRTYHAVFALAGDIDVIYDLAGGVDADGASDPVVKTGKPGLKHSAPQGLFREGHAFAGWYAMPTDRGTPLPVDEQGRATFPERQEIWYAAWDALPHMVTLDANGGAIGGSGSVEATGLIDAPIAYEMPLRRGFTFIGWSSDVHASSGTMTPRFESALDGKRLYALWKAGCSSVAFLANGGAADQVRTGEYGESYTVPEDPTRAGYRFAGWFDAPLDGNRLSLRAGDRLTYTDDANTAHFAHWTAVETQVTLDGQGAMIENPRMSGRFGEPVPYSVPIREGYAFRGWSEDPVAATGSLSLAFPAADTTYYALWAADTVVVAFDAAGGVLAGPAEVFGAYGAAYDLPGNPTRSGYAFRGWATKIAGMADHAIGTFPARNIVYYALWDSTAATVRSGGGGQDSGGNGSQDGSAGEGAGSGGSGSTGSPGGPGSKRGTDNAGGFELVMAMNGGAVYLMDDYESKDKTFLFAPDEGYRLASVTIDGEEVQLDSRNFTYADVEGDHAVDAKFILDTVAPLAVFELAARYNPLLWLIPLAALLALSGGAAVLVTRALRKGKEGEQS